MNFKLFAVLAVLITGIAGIYWWKSHSSAPDAAQQAQAMPPAEVIVQTIQAKPVNLSKDLPGRTTPYRIAEIRPQVNGIVVKRMFEEGSDVKEGQQLYQIDPAIYKAAYDAAQADLLKAEANAKSVIAKNERYAELVKIGGISKQEYDDVQASVSQAKADIAIAKAAVSNAKINLDYTKVFSPISGRIGKSVVTEGALVTQNQTTPLTTVQQLDPIYVDVTQSSAELLKLRRDLASGAGTAEKMPVELFVEGDDQPFAQKGEFQFSDVSVDETTGSVTLRVLFANPEHQLLPGLFVKARIGQSQKDAAILVPQKATTRTPDGGITVVTVDQENKAQARPIKVSNTVGDQWLVTEGLNAGDRVIVEGYQKVKPGDVVKAVEAGASQDAASPSAEPSDESLPKAKE